MLISTETRRGGFVLLEAVVALAILGVASIALLQVRAQQIHVATQARELLTTQALAEDRLSAIRLLDYAMLEDPPDSLSEGVFPPPFENFTWTAEIGLIEDEYDLFGVEVVVLGPVERFPLRTLMHRPRSVLVSGEGALGGSVAGDAAGGRGGDAAGRGGEAGGRGGETGGRGDQTGGRGGQTGGRGGGAGGTVGRGGGPGGGGG
jgi:type II secretory pathway pseudopilin PulG